MELGQGPMENMVGKDIRREFWANRRVLVTGHTGFKGSWLSLWLQNMGAQVIGYSLPPPTKPSLFEVAYVAEGMTSISGDVRDFEKLSAVISEYKPEIVIHMAAQALVRYSYKNPLETYTTNVIGTANILESVRVARCVKAAIIVTSDKCYENKEWLWGYRESDRIGGHDPYSSSKGCAELVTAAYRNSFFPVNQYDAHGIAVASVRAGNVIGGGDWAEDRLIPDIMRAFMEGRPAHIRNPNAIRPWQHVLEPLSGYLLLAEKLYSNGKEFSQPWNFGPDNDDAIQVSKVVESLVTLWGDAVWELDAAPKPHEANYLRLDSSKSRNILGWSPKLHIRKALELTVKWYKGFMKGADISQLTANQIADYENLE